MPAVTAAKPYILKRRSAQYRRRSERSTIACVSAGVRCRLFVLLTVFPDDVQREHVERERDEEQHQAERERGQSLGTVEFLVPDQQRDDLHGDRGHRLEWIRRQVGGKT